jgi:hypothetical protein
MISAPAIPTLALLSNNAVGYTLVDLGATPMLQRLALLRVRKEF